MPLASWEGEARVTSLDGQDDWDTACSSSPHHHHQDLHRLTQRLRALPKPHKNFILLNSCQYTSVQALVKLIHTASQKHPLSHQRTAPTLAPRHFRYLTAFCHISHTLQVPNMNTSRPMGKEGDCRSIESGAAALRSSFSTAAATIVRRIFLCIRLIFSV